ncbi:MAG: hypothetical protein ACLGIM_13810 [Alphaproteobacteria bacterium]
MMAKLTYLPAQPIGDGVYRLQLGRLEVFELETGMVAGGGLRQIGVTPKPIHLIMSSIMSGRIEDGAAGTVGNPFASVASESDILNVVHLGLVGGGMDRDDAWEIVSKFGPPNRPLSEMHDIAAALVYAHIVGVDNEA